MKNEESQGMVGAFRGYASEKPLRKLGEPSRRIVCARVKDTGEFDVVGVVPTTENHNQAPAKCPLAGSLIHTRGESHDNLFSDFVRLGILKWEHGHFDFTEMDHPCPYIQKQQTEDKPS